MVEITEVEDEAPPPQRAAAVPKRAAAPAACGDADGECVTVMLGPGGRLVGAGGARASAAPPTREKAPAASPARASAVSPAAARVAEATGSRPVPARPPPGAAYAAALAQYAAGDFAGAAAAVEAAGAAASAEEQLLLRRARLAANSAAAAAAAVAAADADAARHGAPAADARGRVDSPSQLLVVRALVAALSPSSADDDADDVAPTPGGATMQLLALAQALSKGGEAAQALFRALEGHAAVASHLRAPTLAAAAAALRAGGPPPAAAAALLAAQATHPRADAAATSAALACLAAAAATPEGRIVALAPPPGAGPAPLAPLLALVHTPARLAQLPVQAAEQLAALLGAFAADGASRAALSQHSGGPLSALLELYSAADALPGAGGGASMDPAAAREALARARSAEESRAAVAAAARRVLSPAAAAARRAALAAFAALAAEPALLRAEAFRRNKAGTLERTPLLGRLVAVLRDVAARAPRRTAPLLGWDGRPKGYTQRRYAADFDDNAAGDALLPAALAAASGSAPDAAAVAAAAAPPPGGSLVELALRCVRAALRSSPGNAAKALFASGVLEALEPLYDFATPSVARAAEAAAGAVAAGAPPAAAAIFESQLPAPLAGALAAGDAQLAAAAADKLSALVPTCSGDEFAALTSPGGGLQALHTAICHAEASGAAPHARVVAAFLACAERGRACAGPRRAPAGGYWDVMGAHELARLEAKLGATSSGPPAAPAPPKPTPAAPKAAAPAVPAAKAAPAPAAKAPPPPPAREKPLPWDPTGAAAAAKAKAEAAAAAAKAAAPPPLIKKGFFSAKAPPPAAADPAARRAAVQAAAAAAAAARAAAQAAAWAEPSGGAASEEDEALILEPPAPRTPPGTDGSESNKPEAEFDEDGLRVAFDSAGLGAAGAARRAARTAWASTELRQRLRWSQTTSDVHVSLAMPRGTRARELTVTVTPTRLTVVLAWHGRVVDGPLSRRCKAREAAWALEGDELQLMIPKDDPYFWKALFEGGEEKSHVAVLQELVTSDEASPAYEEMDDEAKDLLADLREQQQMMAEGLIDPINGLDDFRLVLGDGDGGK